MSIARRWLVFLFYGFGVRKTNPAPVSGWTTLFLEWMNAQGLLKH